MAGGRGTRLDADTEKPLYRVGDEPMIDRVRAALAASRVDEVHVVGSPHAPETRAHVADEASYVAAPGDGYVADLGHALGRADVERPILTVAADLPLLAADAVDAVLDAFDGRALAVSVPAALPRRLGASVDTTTSVGGRDLVPTGLNVVAAPDAGEETLLTHDARLAVNVNRQSDAAVAEALLADADPEERAAMPTANATSVVKRTDGSSRRTTDCRGAQHETDPDTDGDPDR